MIILWWPSQVELTVYLFWIITSCFEPWAAHLLSIPSFFIMCKLSGSMHEHAQKGGLLQTAANSPLSSLLLQFCRPLNYLFFKGKKIWLQSCSLRLPLLALSTEKEAFYWSITQMTKAKIIRVIQLDHKRFSLFSFEISLGELGFLGLAH